MTRFSQLIAFVTTVCMLSATTANAATIAQRSPEAHRFHTYNKRSLRLGLEIEIYYPPTSFQTFENGLTQPSSFVEDLEQETVAFVRKQLGVAKESIGWRSGYSTGVARYGYVRQMHDGVPFSNAVANVAWLQNSVVSFGASFVNPSEISPSKPTIDINSAVSIATQLIGGRHNNRTPSVEYLARPDGSARLVYVIQIENEEEHFWFEAFVDAHNGKLIMITDFGAEAVYNAFPLTSHSPLNGQQMIWNPEDRTASPLGWHDSGSGATTSTVGNNVIAYKGELNNVTYQTGPDLEFNYHADPYSEQPATDQNINADRVHGFYVVNTVHDILYRYGFTEAAFNFQQNNFGRGGVQGDPVRIGVQDSTMGYNNAYFQTGPDGEAGICYMLLWQSAGGYRDSAISNDILVHELTHGLTNRMTGGGTARCLQTTEAKGLGEGWSDAFAEWAYQSSPQINDFILGAYITGRTKGVRSYPYSTSSQVNPLTYSRAGSSGSAHFIGEIWANALHNVYAALVERHGYSYEAKTNPDTPEGNAVWLHLFVDGLALQPCNPTMIDARSAWIQADRNRYGGAHYCLLWKVFASKGLGVNAAGFADNFDVPGGC